MSTWSTGSQWHRWDPHIHTPSTLLNNQFKGDWESYLRAIEQAAPAVDALGITDYCVLNGYKDFLEHRKRGRASGVSFVFPNVEFRLSVETKSGKGINVHLLFSPDDPDHIPQIDRLLAEFKFSYKGTAYPCSAEWLIKLGRAVDPALTDPRGALAKGAEQFKLTWPDLIRVVEHDSWARNNCLLAISAHEGDGFSGIKHDGAFEALREELRAQPQIIFSANDADREFWLGRKAGYDRDAVEKTFGSLKPCLHGCDAHRLDQVLKPALSRLCWIRSELSFMGLRQTILEPDLRVHIGEQCPSGPSSGETIRFVGIRDAEWLKHDAIELNDGLVAIIGPRGSGKTALADIIAWASDAPINDEASFLAHARELLGEAAATLTWADASVSENHKLADFGQQDPEILPRVRYLSQQFVDRLCSADALGEELVREIEAVVFQAIAGQDRLGAGSFDELRSLELDGLWTGREADRRSIDELSLFIAQEEQKKGQIAAKGAQLKAQREQAAKLTEDAKALLPTDKKKETERLAGVQAALESRLRTLQAEKLKVKKLDDLASEYSRVRAGWTASFNELRARYAACGLAGSDWATLEPTVSAEISTVLAPARRAAETRARTIEKGDPAAPRVEADLQTWSVVELQQLQAALTADLGMERQRALKHRELTDKTGRSSQEIEKLEKELADLQAADERINNARLQRREVYSRIFQSFADEQETLERLYAPLQERLSAEEILESRLAFYVRREVDVAAWAVRGEALLDLRKAGPFRGGRLEEVAHEALEPAWRTGGSADVAKAMEAFIGTHWRDLIASRLSGIERQALARWLFSTEHVSLHYAISYDGVDISKLSPGIRGIVLLMLYLAVDQWDTRPLVVDQPEENLDPQSVYDELVKYFRLAKRRRQVILVTHNPNLVVNADADQVIVARATRERVGGLPSISYTSGGLEDKQTRTDVCRILEGGERAFLERERRYALAKSPRAAM